MPAASPKLDLLENLKSDIGIAEEVADQAIELTPHLALAVALLYMIASDGEIEDQESSQLQAVLGGDKEVLRYGLAYVKSTSIEQFLQEAPEVLSHKDRLCILTNVCDSLLSDGHADDEELTLFYRMANALGSSAKAFEPYYKTIALKNDKTVLGTFQGKADEISQISPHHALAISLLYMMTADGAIGSEEIGQLEAVIGEFDGLQKAALKYVRQTKVKQFLDQATPSLTTEQRLYILVNVCDSMLSDGNVALLENKLFQTILTAFGYDDSSFESYYQTIAIKNIKPFDTREFKPKMTHRRSRANGKEEGVEFEKKLTPGDKGYQAPADVYNTAANQEVWADGADKATSMGAMIQRTMQENIEHVVEDFGSNANVIQVAHNATDELNVQQLAQSLNADNLQHVDGSVDAADNRQTFDSQAGTVNRQTLSTAPADANIQSISLTEAGSNLQVIDSTALTDHHEAVSLEVRMQTLYEDIDGLKQRLNRFESENKDFLDAIRAEMLIDVEGVVTDVSPEEQELLNMVADFQRIDNVQDIPLANGDENVQQISLAESGDNLQQVPELMPTENVQQIALSDTSDNIQDIALGRDTKNIQTVTSASTASNYQRIHGVKQLSVADFAGQADSTLTPTDFIQASITGLGDSDDSKSATDTFLQVAATGEVASLASASNAFSIRQRFSMGRNKSANLNLFYDHAKTVIVFVLFVFAMPMDMKLPMSRITSGFLITSVTHSKQEDAAKHDAPLEEHVAQEKIVEEVEQTFDLVRLKRD